MLLICDQIITPYPKEATCYCENKIFFLKSANGSLVLDLNLRFQALNVSPVEAPVIQHIQGNHSLHKSGVSALMRNSWETGAFSGADILFLTTSLHFLLVQGFSATSQMFLPPLIKPLVLWRQKSLLPVATPHLKPPGCPVPLLLTTFSRAARL